MTKPISAKTKTKSSANQPQDNLILKADNLYKTFGQTAALRGASLNITQGDILAIMGPSGSGKSTLLHCLAGIITPDQGQVSFNQQIISKLNEEKRTALRRQDFGFIFQFGQLIPELTAIDNVAVPLLLNKTNRNQAYQQARTWLNKVGLANHIDKLPGQLSGGQAQRVAIARAMITQPQVLFADEPTGSLDSLSGEKVMDLFIQTAKEQGTTVILVTHEARIAAYANQTVIVRDGKVVS